MEIHAAAAAEFALTHADPMYRDGRVALFCTAPALGGGGGGFYPMRSLLKPDPFSVSSFSILQAAREACLTGDGAPI